MSHACFDVTSAGSQAEEKMAIKFFRANKKAITALKLIPLVLIIYTCEERTFDNPFDSGVELNPNDWAPTNLTIEILRSEEHTSELQSRRNLVCRLLLEKKN